MSLVWVGSTAGKKWAKWEEEAEEEEEEWRGGWCLVIALQGTSGQMVSYIPLTNTHKHMTHMKICWHTSASEDVENPLYWKKRGGGRRGGERGVEERRKQREGGSMTKNRKRRRSEFVAWYESGWLLSHMEPPTNANSNIGAGGMCDRWTHQQWVAFGK